MARLIEDIKPDFVFEDSRGRLVQLARGGYKQINAVISEKGASRGGHCHANNTETFYIIEGSCRVDVKKDGEALSREYKAGDMFCILPGVYHSFEYHEKSILTVMYDNGVENEDGSKDIIAARGDDI